VTDFDLLDDEAAHKEYRLKCYDCQTETDLYLPDVDLPLMLQNVTAIEYDLNPSLKGHLSRKGIDNVPDSLTLLWPCCPDCQSQRITVSTHWRRDRDITKTELIIRGILPDKDHQAIWIAPR
jgi:hypothetical protein